MLHKLILLTLGLIATSPTWSANHQALTTDMNQPTLAPTTRNHMEMNMLAEPTLAFL